MLLAGALTAGGAAAPQARAHGGFGKVGGLGFEVWEKYVGYPSIRGFRVA